MEGIYIVTVFVIGMVALVALAAIRERAAKDESAIPAMEPSMDNILSSIRDIIDEADGRRDKS